jgi:hypothetical protein
MSLYRKNIGGPQQVARLVVGAVIVGLAALYLAGPLAWLAAISGAVFAFSGLFGYCPMCAVAGIGPRQ